MDFAASKIIQLRKKLKLTQKEFADQLGYSRTYLSDIELEKVSASRRFLEALTKTFGVSLDSLMTSGFADWISYTVQTLKDEQIFFFYVYGFTDEELRFGEYAIKNYLSGSEHVEIDASNMKTAHELISSIMEKKVSSSKIYEQYEKFCEEKDWFFIFIKNLSLSKIHKKGNLLKRIMQSSVHQAVIVLDRPCFLERNHAELYAHAKITQANSNLC